jgi:hypothetical protein
VILFVSFLIFSFLKKNSPLKKICQNPPQLMEFSFLFLHKKQHPHLICFGCFPYHFSPPSNYFRHT